MNPMDEESSLDSLEIGQRNVDDEPTPPRRRGAPVWPWIVLALLLIGALVYFFLLKPKAPDAEVNTETARTETSETESPAEPEVTEPAIALPPLEQSDPVIRQLLETLTAHPALANLVTPDGLVRRFVASVDNIAEGVSPRPHLGFLQPKAGFHTAQEGGQLVATPETYGRYDRWARLFASLDPAETARVYRTIEPLLQESYVGLGYPDVQFRDTLIRAIDRLIATPEVAEDAKLVPKVSSYAFRDPEIEALGPAEKHLLRMGPDNARVVREHLEKIRLELMVTAPFDPASEEAASDEPAEVDSEG